MCAAARHPRPVPDWLRRSRPAAEHTPAPTDAGPTSGRRHLPVRWVAPGPVPQQRPDPRPSRRSLLSHRAHPATSGKSVTLAAARPPKLKPALVALTVHLLDAGSELTRRPGSMRWRAPRGSAKLDPDPRVLPVRSVGEGGSVLVCTTPALGTRSRSRSAYASARSRHRRRFDDASEDGLTGLLPETLIDHVDMVVLPAQARDGRSGDEAGRCGTEYRERGPSPGSRLPHGMTSSGT